MKKSELTLFTIDSAGKEREYIYNGKELAINLIDYSYRLSDEIQNQIDISGVSINEAIDYVLDAMSEHNKTKRAKLTEHKFNKEYNALFYALVLSMAFNNYLEDEDYTEAVDCLFFANTMFEKYKEKSKVDLDSMDKYTKIILSKNASKAARARVDNDPKTKYVKEIKEVEYPLKMRLFHLRGRRDEFITDMHVKYPDLSRDTIANLVDKLNKQNGISQRKPK